MFYFSENSIKNMEGVEFDLKQVAYRALTISKVDFGIPSTGGLRTEEQQKLLFSKGKSKADGVNNRSKHQANKAGKSTAIDFYAYVDGHANWEPWCMTQIAAAFLQAANELGIRIKWGGFFHSLTDMPHVELVVEYLPEG